MQVQSGCSLTTMKLHEVADKARGLVATQNVCLTSITRSGTNVGNGIQSIQWYQCQGFGHMAHECPNRMGGNGGRSRGRGKDLGAGIFFGKNNVRGGNQVRYDESSNVSGSPFNTDESKTSKCGHTMLSKWLPWI